MTVIVKVIGNSSFACVCELTNVLLLAASIAFGTGPISRESCRKRRKFGVRDLPWTSDYA